MRMIWCTLLVIDFKLLNHSPDGVMDKMSALVTHHNPGTSKSGDHLLKQ
jgi:hypothetical protein